MLMGKIIKFLRKIDSSPALALLFFEIVLGMALSIVSFLFFAKISRGVLNDRYFNLDSVIIGFFYTIRSPLLTQVMEFFSFLGKDVWIFSSAPIIIILAIKKHKKEAFLFSIALLMGYVINMSIKWFIARPRPLISPLTLESFYSFPSGHSMDSFVFYSLIAFFVFRFTRNKKLSITICALSFLLVVLISVSRIYLGVHYPTDVIAGMIGGFWWVVTVIFFEKIMDFYRIYKKIST